MSLQPPSADTSVASGTAQDDRNNAQNSTSSSSAPPPRRSVSFGPASVSPSMNGNAPLPLSPSPTDREHVTILGDSSAQPSAISSGIPTASAAGRRIASGSSSSSVLDVGGIPGSSTIMTPSTSSTGVNSTATPVLKPALKATSQSKRLPPHAQYQHPDPLLRRLRLVDDKGNAIDLKHFFRGVKVVAFYFSSQWAGQPLKEYHNTISQFAREHSSEFRVIYVSVDVDEQWYKAGIKGQPWVSMVWNDGSSLPSPSATNATSPSAPKENGSEQDPPPMYNNEDFLLAQEADIDESLAKTDTSGEAYLRPFSRVHLASKLNIIAAPTVCIYHLERQKMLDWNVRMARLHQNQRDETWSRWRRGEGARTYGLMEALGNSPGTMALMAFALIYWIMILAGGQEYNFLRRFVESFDRKATQDGVGEALGKVADQAREHLEF